MLIIWNMLCLCLIKRTRRRLVLTYALLYMYPPLHEGKFLCAAVNHPNWKQCHSWAINSCNDLLCSCSWRQGTCIVTFNHEVVIRKFFFFYHGLKCCCKLVTAVRDQIKQVDDCLLRFILLVKTFCPDQQLQGSHPMLPAAGGSADSRCCRMYNGRSDAE